VVSVVSVVMVGIVTIAVHACLETVIGSITAALT
jgi:small basic protein